MPPIVSHIVLYVLSVVNEGVLYVEQVNNQWMAESNVAKKKTHSQISIHLFQTPIIRMITVRCTIEQRRPKSNTNRIFLTRFTIFRVAEMWNCQFASYSSCISSGTYAHNKCANILTLSVWWFCKSERSDQMTIERTWRLQHRPKHVKLNAIYAELKSWFSLPSPEPNDQHHRAVECYIQMLNRTTHKNRKAEKDIKRDEWNGIESFHSSV